MAEKNYFEVLNSIDCSSKIEKKNGLSYLSWAYAWGELKKKYPEATYTIYENAQGWNYFTDGRTCWVKTGVTVNGIEHVEYLPVMDFRNKSIAADAVTSFDVNKAIQRSLTKAVARHGLGLYIYAGEDLPEEACATEQPKTKTAKTSQQEQQPVQQQRSEARQKLKDFCIKYEIDQAEVIKACNLNANSTDEDFETAHAYAVELLSRKIKRQKEQEKQSDVPFEV